MKNSFLKSTFLLIFSLFMVQLMAQTLTSTTGHVNLRNQNIFGDNSTAFYFKSNHGSNVNLVLRDRENMVYGKLIGSSNGANFGLAVNGKIRAKEVIVESGWSDFVFEDDYNLPTLKEEKLFIKQKGHLIGFESEEAMGGMIQMGDVVNRQQQKIEESVLHLIELDEKIQELEKENDLLKKKNKDLILLNDQLMKLQSRVEALESKE